MKLNMEISKRDKKLLIFLGALVIGVIFYLVFLSPLYTKYSSEKSKNIELNEKYTRLQNFNKDYEKNKEKYNEQKLNYINISRQIPTNLSEKYILNDLYNISKSISASPENYTFSKKEDFKDFTDQKGESKSKENKSIFTYSATTTWNIEYTNFKKLLSLANQYESLFYLNNIYISPSEDNKLTASFKINFLGYEDENAPLKPWKDLKISTGKNKIFSDVETVSLNSEDRPLSSQQTLSGNSDIKTIGLVEKEKDFIAVLSTVNSPTSSITIEKVGTGSSIFGLNKQIENAEISIKGENGKYQYSLITEREKSPLNGFSDFETKGDNIVVVVYSTARKGETDKNIINLKVNNKTDKKAYVYVIGDDEKLPRCSITKGGSVYVEKL